MKVLFCDIDGVLNFASYGVDTYFDKYCNEKVALDDKCIERLKRLLEMFSDLKIVWSTDWRYVDTDWWHSWKNPVKYLESEFPWLAERVIGKTPKKMSSDRWHEVKWWIDEHRDEIDAYVILDDIVFPSKWFGIEKHCVECKFSEGFTEDKFKEAVRILNNDI